MAAIPQNVTDSLLGVFADRDAVAKTSDDLGAANAALANAQHDQANAVTAQATAVATLTSDFDAFVKLARDTVFPAAAPTP